MISIPDIILTKANRKLNEPGKISQRLAGIKRIITFDCGESKFNFLLESGRLSLMAGEAKPDIMISASAEDIMAIAEKRLNPMEAYSEGKLKIKASLLDKLLISELLS